MNIQLKWLQHHSCSKEDLDLILDYREIADKAYFPEDVFFSRTYREAQMRVRTAPRANFLPSQAVTIISAFSTI